MIPRGSILGSFEGIGKRVARCDRALRDAVDTVHVHRLLLSNPVPVDASAILCHSVDYRDFQGLLISKFARIA